MNRSFVDPIVVGRGKLSEVCEKYKAKLRWKPSTSTTAPKVEDNMPPAPPPPVPNMDIPAIDKIIQEGQEKQRAKDELHSIIGKLTEAVREQCIAETMVNDCKKNVSVIVDKLISVLRGAN